MTTKKITETILYWIWSFTWGVLMTLVGLIITIGCLITGHKPHRFHKSIYFVFGTGGWGFNAGPFFFISTDSTDSLSMKQHEAGHGIQNLIFGPLMPFVVAIPSAIRFWYREWLVNSGREKPWNLRPYDSMWFEGWATSLGKKYYPE